MELEMEFIRKMPSPQELKVEHPVEPAIYETKRRRDGEIRDILTGKDNRFLLIIGPCSADNEDAVVDYCHRLAEVQEQVKDTLYIIPRVYTNKPRTTGEGYMGMIHQPDPEKRPSMAEGLHAIRHMHMRVLKETGFSTADEMLYPDNVSYLDDIMSYIAVGARSVENQQHRLTASGLDIPVGMKNPTGGDLSVMMNSLTAAQASHVFLYRGWEVKSEGNPLAHAILRGAVDPLGRTLPNYHYEDLITLYDLYQKKNYQNPAVIVDANHANSGKKYMEQIRICNEVLHSCRHSKEIASLVKGFMIESYIEDGAQKIGEGVYGRSITDPCLGWEKSERLIYDIADQL